ncbi:MAG: hypothetical protein ABR980_01330 [Ignavibacteriaceae bacterium]|jgi:hypothetical protein
MAEQTLFDKKPNISSEMLDNNFYFHSLFKSLKIFKSALSFDGYKQVIWVPAIENVLGC